MQGSIHCFYLLFLAVGTSNHPLYRATRKSSALWKRSGVGWVGDVWEKEEARGAPKRAFFIGALLPIFWVFSCAYRLFIKREMRTMSKNIPCFPTKAGKRGKGLKLLWLSPSPDATTDILSSEIPLPHFFIRSEISFPKKAMSSDRIRISTVYPFFSGLYIRSCGKSHRVSQNDISRRVCFSSSLTNFLFFYFIAKLDVKGQQLLPSFFFIRSAVDKLISRFLARMRRP